MCDSKQFEEKKRYSKLALSLGIWFFGALQQETCQNGHLANVGPGWVCPLSCYTQLTHFLGTDMISSLLTFSSEELYDG